MNELDLRSVLPLEHLTQDVETRYRLIANICHEGSPEGGMYKVHVHRDADGKWYEIADLRVTEIMREVVALSEMYLQVWARM